MSVIAIYCSPDKGKVHHYEKGRHATEARACAQSYLSTDICVEIQTLGSSPQA
jgi:hypothetical protein